MNLTKFRYLLFTYAIFQVRSACLGHLKTQLACRPTTQPEAREDFNVIADDATVDESSEIVVIPAPAAPAPATSGTGSTASAVWRPWGSKKAR